MHIHLQKKNKYVTFQLWQSVALVYNEGNL